MKRGPTGRYEITAVGGEEVRAFVPDPLPPNPPLEMSHARQRLLVCATLALGRLDSITVLLPDPVRSEADWEAWVDFFLEGVEQTATNAVDTVRRLASLFEEDRTGIQGFQRAQSLQGVVRAPVGLVPSGLRAHGAFLPGGSEGHATLDESWNRA